MENFNEEDIRLRAEDLLDDEEFWEDLFDMYEPITSGGNSEGKHPEDFDKNALAIGIIIEYEHTDDDSVACEIAMDHLTEYPNYYEALLKMETELSKRKEAAKDRKPDKAKRGTVVFPSDSILVNDNKDHFPYNNVDQARSALSRVAQYQGLPGWYDGDKDLKSFKTHVRNTILNAFPSIDKE